MNKTRKINYKKRLNKTKRINGGFWPFDYFKSTNQVVRTQETSTKLSSESSTKPSTNSPGKLATSTKSSNPTDSTLKGVTKGVVASGVAAKIAITTGATAAIGSTVVTGGIAGVAILGILYIGLKIKTTSIKNKELIDFIEIVLDMLCRVYKIYMVMLDISKIYNVQLDLVTFKLNIEDLHEALIKVAAYETLNKEVYLADSTHAGKQERVLKISYLTHDLKKIELIEPPDIIPNMKISVLKEQLKEQLAPQGNVDNPYDDYSLFIKKTKKGALYGETEKYIKINDNNYVGSFFEETEKDVQLYFMPNSYESTSMLKQLSGKYKRTIGYEKTKQKLEELLEIVMLSFQTVFSEFLLVLSLKVLSSDNNENLKQILEEYYNNYLKDRSLSPQQEATALVDKNLNNEDKKNEDAKIEEDHIEADQKKVVDYIPSKNEEDYVFTGNGKTRKIKRKDKSHIQKIMNKLDKKWNMFTKNIIKTKR